jgi:hypothetical protein
MPLPNTREYASRVIKRSVKKSLISEADSASSCPSSSSGSEAEDDAAAPHVRTRGRRLLRLKYSLNCDSSSLKIPSLHFVVPHAKTGDKSLIIIPNLLTKKKILKMEAMFRSSPSSYIINDRKSDLVYAAMNHSLLAFPYLNPHEYIPLTPHTLNRTCTHRTVRPVRSLSRCVQVPARGASG